MLRAPLDRTGQMENHDGYAEELSEFLEGGLSLSRRGAVARHLGDCAACRAAIADFRRIRILAREIPQAHLAVDLWPVILARLQSASFNSTTSPASEERFRPTANRARDCLGDLRAAQPARPTIEARIRACELG